MNILENHLTHGVEYEMKIDQIGIDNLQQFGDFRSIQNGAAPSKPIVNNVKNSLQSRKKKNIYISPSILVFSINHAWMGGGYNTANANVLILRDPAKMILMVHTFVLLLY